MPDERLWRARSLNNLRDMLRRLILEEHATRDLNPEKAAHLADAVSDLRTIIARLESDAAGAPGNGREPHRSRLSTDPSHGEQDDTDPPRELKPIAHRMEQRV